LPDILSRLNTLSPFSIINWPDLAVHLPEIAYSLSSVDLKLDPGYFSGNSHVSIKSFTIRLTISSLYFHLNLLFELIKKTISNKNRKKIENQPTACATSPIYVVIIIGTITHNGKNKTNKIYLKIVFHLHQFIAFILAAKCSVTSS